MADPTVTARQHMMSACSNIDRAWDNNPAHHRSLLATAQVYATLAVARAILETTYEQKVEIPLAEFLAEQKSYEEAMETQ